MVFPAGLRHFLFPCSPLETLPASQLAAPGNVAQDARIHMLTMQANTFQCGHEGRTMHYAYARSQHICEWSEHIFN